MKSPFLKQSSADKLSENNKILELTRELVQNWELPKEKLEETYYNKFIKNEN